MSERDVVRDGSPHGQRARSLDDVNRQLLARMTHPSI
jgi:hypothetical protein